MNQTSIPSILLGLSALGLASCERSRPSATTDASPRGPDRYKERTDAFELADVQQDVEQAISRGDRRFLCVTGEGVYAPGLPDSEFPPGVGESKVDKTRFRIIDGTYDEIDPSHSGSHSRFKKAAHNYAQEYNRVLKEAIANK